MLCIGAVFFNVCVGAVSVMVCIGAVFVTVCIVISVASTSHHHEVRLHRGLHQPWRHLCQIRKVSVCKLLVTSTEPECFQYQSRMDFQSVWPHCKYCLWTETMARVSRCQVDRQQRSMKNIHRSDHVGNQWYGNSSLTFTICCFLFGGNTNCSYPVLLFGSSVYY